MERRIHVYRTLVFLLLLALVVPAAADNLRIHVLPRPDAPALLPVIESNYNPNARSPGGAEAERDQHVGAAANAAVEHHRHALADRRLDRRQRAVISRPR